MKRLARNYLEFKGDDMDEKILISVGCTNYLVTEVEQLRRKNEILSAENQVMHCFFSMFDRMGSKPSQGYAEDRLYQAKKEIREATDSKRESK